MITCALFCTKIVEYLPSHISTDSEGWAGLIANPTPSPRATPNRVRIRLRLFLMIALILSQVPMAGRLVSQYLYTPNELIFNT